ncbi:FkbM family methyltransferase [Tolypothrix sp. FACHB-123]|uniref:FkbM family methyltransferase n=1 Tax=Tolypothrix sp. FACHB-123 TaxID=2692868 RepID=UPI001682B0A5|nr:FkbM family methyltransferase [Tolypothrix sp. FACHB-123]MBD2353379.1 FkbM family methyltransferase [Tolypothrix sp. FACHB-123]
MPFFSQFTRRLNSLANYIENPQLFGLRQRGGLPNTFLQLNQPWLHSLNINTVIDIGANTGQFALTINKILSKAKIYSFEPLPECFEKLQTLMSNCKNFTGFNVALGDEPGNLTFEKNAFTPSSSFLKMTDLHKTVYPHTKNTNYINVKVETLDHIINSLEIGDNILIKLDVQGYEYKVIRGAENTIMRCKLLIIETSFEPLYEGQPLFNDLYNELIKYGFVYAGAIEQNYNPQNGKILQADSIFIRDK